MIDLAAAQRQIGYVFSDPSLLLRALTHRSYLNEAPEHPVPHNERLEFLGDAVIGFLVGEYLFHQLPQRREGELSFLRSALVRTEALADFATKIDLGTLVLMGRGEEASGGRERASLLADTFEAVIAAIYLDGGMDAVKQWMDPLLKPAVRQLLSSGSTRDAKSYLQELAQGELGLTPVYEVVEEVGPDHERIFTMQVRIGDEVRGSGTGRSKQLAAQAAAQAALLTFGIEHEG